MKILVSTKQTQNDRPGDFSWAPEGEPVTAGSYGLCDSYRLARGGLSNCGCDRSFTSIETGQSTTTALIVERDITRDALIDTLAKRLVKAWDAPESEMRELATEEVDEMLATAEQLTLGRVVGQDIEHVFTR